VRKNPDPKRKREKVGPAKASGKLLNNWLGDAKNEVMERSGQKEEEEKIKGKSRSEKRIPIDIKEKKVGEESPLRGRNF